MILWPKRVNAFLWLRGSWKGDTLMRCSFLPVIIMPTSKFHISFTLTVPNDTARPSMHEFTLDLGLGNGACHVSGVSGARVAMGEGPPAKRTTVAPEAVPVQDPATSTGRGSFNSDQNNGYPHEWPNIEAFHEWRQSKERTHTIELRVAKVKHGAEMLGRTLWTTKHVYCCARQRIGQKADQKKHPESQRKVPRKGTGCHCQIIIKRYLHTPIVLGHYAMEHNHNLGMGNMIYMCLLDGTQQQMKLLLIQKVDTQEIVCVNLIFDWPC